MYNDLLVDFSKWVNMIGGRDMAYDEIQKQKKCGIYRIKIEDIKENIKENTKENKIKFKYYYLKNDEEITDVNVLNRINKLGLAPAYVDVWVSENPDSKI